MALEDWQRWVRSWGDERFWLLAEEAGSLVGAVLGRLFPDDGNIRHLLLRDQDDLELGRRLCLGVAAALGEAGAQQVVVPTRPDDPAYVEPVLRLLGAKVTGSLDVLRASL